MLKGVGFEVSNVSWNYGPVRAEGVAPLPLSINSFDVRCNNCMHQWHASESMALEPGKFHARIGWVTILCPECNQEHTVENPLPV